MFVFTFDDIIRNSAHSVLVYINIVYCGEMQSNPFVYGAEQNGVLRGVGWFTFALNI